jgi:hypothetical protein
MAKATQVRVIFYNSSTSAFQSACGLNHMCDEQRRGFLKALPIGERLLRQGLAAVFDEVSYLTIVQTATQLSSPQGLRNLVGKAILVVDPNEEMVRDFLEGYSKPEGSEEISVRLEEGYLDAGLNLVVEEIPPRQADGETSAS